MKNLTFEGSGQEYFKIWIVNILLIIVTLGLYYPWAKVRNHRYFYANSTLEDRSFNYHATGKQLFISYLIGTGLFIVYSIVESFSAIGGLILLEIFFLSFPWIVWRSLKFNLRATSFSNVRFSFEGALSGAYVNYFLLPIVVFLAVYSVPVLLVIAFGGEGAGSVGGLAVLGIVISLVLAFYLMALLNKKSTTYTLSSYRFGQGQFSTLLETKEFAKILIKTIGLGVVVMVGFMMFMGVVVAGSIGLEGVVSIQEGLIDQEKMKDILSRGILFMIVVPIYLGLFVASFIVYSYSTVRQREYIFKNSRLDDVITFSSGLTVRAMAWIAISNLVLIVITFGLAMPWAKVRMTRYMLENTYVNSEADIDQYMTEKQEEQSSLGAQIGDAFDVDVGIGI